MATTKKKVNEEEPIMQEEKKVEKVENEVPEFDANAYMNERVPFYAFRDNDKYKDDIVVGVNGKMYRIKRGVQVMIPRNVYLVLKRSMNQDAKTADMIAEKSNEYAAEARSMNL